MLEEMGSAVGLVRLRAASGINPDTDGSGLRMGLRLCGDSQAVGEGGNLRQWGGGAGCCEAS